MSITEGYTQEVRTQGSESSATSHAKFIRFHYVLEEISGGYNATITFQTRGNGSSCTARNGYSYVTIQGNTTRIDWTSQNELSMPNNTNWIDIISNTVYVPASNAVTLAFSGGNIDISEAGGSSSTAFNLNGTASDTLQLTPVTIWHGRIYGSANSQTSLVTDLYGSASDQTQRIAKLYGPANGQAKLTHQGFGHLDYYGTVTYYTDSNHTDIAIQTLHSTQNIRGLSGYSHQNRLTWSVTINGVSISNKDIYGVTLTEKVKSLPSYFLSGCSALNSDLILPSSLTAINDSGEQNGSAFLYRCDGMTATVNVGNLPTSIVKKITDVSFSTGNNSSAAAFTQGIKIAGANRAAWLAAFPNHSSYSPYRKLVDAGY